jgi:hypothetical protein
MSDQPGESVPPPPYAPLPPHPLPASWGPGTQTPQGIGGPSIQGPVHQGSGTSAQLPPKGVPVAGQPYPHIPPPPGWPPTAGPSPVSARPSSRRWWMVAAVAVTSAALVGAATAVVMSSLTSTPRPRTPAQGAPAEAAPSQGSGPAGATPSLTSTPTHAATQAPLGISFPDTFQQFPRADDGSLGQQAKQLASTLAKPGEKESSALYANDPTTPLKSYFAVGIVSATAFSSPSARVNELLTTQDVSAGAKVESTAPEDVDPGPQGGVMRCIGTSTIFYVGTGQISKLMIACAWANNNVAGLLMTQASLTGAEPGTTAELTRQLRAQSETGSS